MAVKPIRLLPDVVLRKKAKRIPVIDQTIVNLANDMVETLVHVKGLGLAAPQVGVSLRLAVFHMAKEEPFVLVNPEVVKRFGEREIVEGCLSIPGYEGRVKRSVRVTVKGMDIQGKPVRINAQEILAQCLEHEIDHLNGVLYIDRIESPDKFYRIEPKKLDLKEAEETADASS